MKCRICGQNSNFVFTALVLNKYQVSYYSCPQCEYLQTEDPYWLEEAYKAPINISDTGLLVRNIELSRDTASILYYFFKKDGMFIDYAGGFGVFTRLMRDIGFDYYWHDPMTSNLLSKGFEADETFETFELLTTFESFEHFADPMAEVKKMMTFSKNILFSTYLQPTNVPSMDWWYYQFYHGQHISFYSKKCLAFMAKKNGLHFYSFGRLHLFSQNKINQYLIRLILMLNHVGSFWFLKKRMNSKTNSDSLLLSSQHNK